MKTTHARVLDLGQQLVKLRIRYSKFMPPRLERMQQMLHSQAQHHQPPKNPLENDQLAHGCDVAHLHDRTGTPELGFRSRCSIPTTSTVADELSSRITEIETENNKHTRLGDATRAGWSVSGGRTWRLYMCAVIQSRPVLHLSRPAFIVYSLLG